MEHLSLNDREPAPAGSDDKSQILTKYADKIKTDEFHFSRGKTNKDKADRATVEQVLDPRTLRFLGKLIHKGIIDGINGCLSTGKEANVYHADNAASGQEFAVKIYKTSILVFKDRERYVDGEFRFRNARSQHNPRKMVKIWAEKEFRNLKRLYLNGIPCPQPVDLKLHVLVMELLSRGDGFALPKLRDHPFLGPEEVLHYYLQMLVYMRRLFQVCRLVHADLSEYNLIVHQDKLYLIDVSQLVEPEHPMLLDFLRMDIKNVNDFFDRKGINVYPERLIFRFITESLETLGIEARPVGMPEIHVQMPVSGNKVEEEAEEDDQEEEEEEEESDTETTPADDPAARHRGDPREYDEDALKLYLESLPFKGEDAHEDEEDEVFRSVHLVRSLNHLEERDFNHMAEGRVDTFRLLVEGVVAEPNESESESDDSSDVSSEEEKEWKERPQDLKGKRFEDKEAKKARKLAAKEDKAEKRKTKMKKHLKKKLVNKGSNRK